MSKIKCLIVDDEAAAHYVLVNFIQHIDSLELSGHCYNALEAINFLHKQPVDLLFLDINMPELTGFDLLNSLTNPPKVILTTAYSEFALDSYEYGAIDYLLKPIAFPRFLKAVERYLSLTTTKPAQRIAEPEDDTLVLKAEGGWLRIDQKDFLYAQSLGNYVKVYTPKKSHLVSITTTELEQKLSADRFMRVHKSYIVALDKISKYVNHTVFVGDAEIPVGITYRRELGERVR